MFSECPAGEPAHSTEETSTERDVAGPRQAQDRTMFMVGTSACMQNVFDQIRRFARCDAPVLITGESGTGKELAARAIHDHSRRAGGRFVAINCAAIPATLIASELFGYERSAFTGAYARKHGQIERAQHGTLFLDEIGDMPPELQGHLLRFLERGEITRVGGCEPIKVDVRIIAATNVRLPQAITDGRLREDLYYRLNVLGLRMPPLRERPGDIRLLAQFYVRQVAREFGLNVNAIAPDAVDAMEAYAWPGNVRELVGTIRRAAVLSDGPEIALAQLGLNGMDAVGNPEANRATRPAPASEAERALLQKTLQQRNCNITKAARDLKVSRVTFYRMLRRNQLSLRHEYVVQQQVG